MIDLNVSLKQIAKGDFSNILPQVSSQIRIFISSTFTDFSEERNSLFEKTYPSLRQYCKERHNKELFFVDLRWGITDHNTNNNITISICLQELERCQNESIGPTIIAFLSHRYGTRFLLENIESDEFENLKKTADSIPYQIGGKRVPNLLEYCYDLDENGIKTNYYKLKTIQNILEEIDSDKRYEIWKEIQNLLIKLMREAAVKNYEDGLFTESQKDRYFISATENEIQKGILDINENERQLKCLVFLREIKDFKPDDKNAKQFKDDYPEAHDFLKKLKEKIIESDSLTTSFEVNWLQSGEFKKPYIDYLKKYLENFSNEFYHKIRLLIDRNIEILNQQNINPLYEELNQHARFCNKLIKNFHPRKKLESEIEDYINSENKKPFFIIGESGSGKSVLIANSFIKRNSIDEIKIIRFMGTSRQSSDISSVMDSVIEQLDVLFTIPDMLKQVNLKNSVFESSDKKSKRFQKILQNISESLNNKKLIIFLDSIDQLSSKDYDLEWMFYNLPNNIKIIYSLLTSTNKQDIESDESRQLESRIYEKFEYNKLNYLKMDKMDRKETRLILDTMLGQYNRKLSDINRSNLEGLLKKFDKGIYPLHIKLLFDIISKWTSGYDADYDNENDFYSCTNTIDTIKYIFNKLEYDYGQMLFSRCVFYLTLFEYNGISESELEDIMSIDDDVLTSVFQYHHPPLRKFPILLWIRIKYEINDYLTNKQIDDISVVSWFHRSFIEASKDYYQDLFKSSPERDKVIMNVIDYFTEKWNEKKSNEEKGEMKEFSYKNSCLPDFECKDKNKHLYQAYRNTSTQKIKIGDSFNKRKLNEFVNVVMKLYDEKLKVELLLKHVFLDCDFMYGKVRLHGLYFVIDVFDMVTEIKQKNEKNNSIWNWSNNKIGKNESLYELYVLSSIFKDKLVFIQQDPYSGLGFLIYRHLKRKEKSYAEFSKQTGLVLQQINMPIMDQTRVIFLAVKEEIKQIFWNNNDDRYFIALTTSEEKFKSLYLIDFKTTKVIQKLLYLKDFFQVHQILLSVSKKNNRNLVLRDFNGKIYYSTVDNHALNINTIDVPTLKVTSHQYSLSGKVSFNKISCLHRSYLLDPYHYLVLIPKSLYILDVSSGIVKTIKQENYKNYIKYFGSTLEIQSDQILSPQDYNSISQITFVVGLSDNRIIAYKYYIKDCIFSIICNIDVLSNWSSIYIDRSITIDKSPNDFYLIVVLESNKILNVKNNGSYNEIVTIDEDLLKLNLKSKIKNERDFKMISFFNKTILFSYLQDYDKDKNEIIKLFSYSLDERLFVTNSQSLNEITFLNRKNEKSEKSDVRQIIKALALIDDEHLLILTYSSGLVDNYRNNSSLMDLITYSFENSNIRNKSFPIVLDILNFSTNKIVKRCNHFDSQESYKIIGCSKDYIIIKRGSGSDSDIYFYHLRKDINNNFNFVSVLWCSSVFEFHSYGKVSCSILKKDNTTNKIILGSKMYKRSFFVTHNYLSIRVIEHKPTNKSSSFFTEEGCLKKDEDLLISFDTEFWKNNKIIEYYVSYLQKYLIYITKNNNGIKTLWVWNHVQGNRYNIKLEEDDIQKVLIIDNTNDFIICCKNHIYYLKTANDNIYEPKVVYFNEDNLIINIFFMDNCLFVQNELSLEIYVIDKKNVCIDLVFIIDNIVNALSLSPNKKYLALSTKNNEILLYKNTNSHPIYKKIGYLQLDYEIDDIFVSKSRVAISFARFKGLSKLLTFSIVDSTA